MKCDLLGKLTPVTHLVYPIEFAGIAVFEIYVQYIIVVLTYCTLLQYPD